LPDGNDVSALREFAKHARELAKRINDKEAVAGLLQYAEQQEAKAAEIEAITVLPDAAAIPSGEPTIARAGASLKSEAPTEPDKPASDNSVK
jgi:hypothetical protein